MTHTYKVTGMTCGGCETSVKSSLLKIPGVTGAEVSRDTQSATITMDRHIRLDTLQQSLGEKYKIMAEEPPERPEQVKDRMRTYKPILLIFGYITAIAIIAGSMTGEFHWMRAMNIFMAGFFLAFSFFKMLDLKGFAESYAMYDLVAKPAPAWGYIYAFVELGLGLAYATGFQPLYLNMITFLVMTVSIIGVLRSVWSHQKIKCACLGVVFNLPMSTITILEDGLMILMSAGMIIALI